MRRTLLIAVGVLAISAASFAQSAAGAAASRLAPRAGALSSIQGSAVTGSNGVLKDTVVRLRDVRYGKVLNTVMTDKQGAFLFRGVDPGNYVVEVMNPANNAVLASSQMMNVTGGEALQALVKLPFRIPPIAGLLGNSSQTTAQAVSTAAQAVTAAATSNNTIAETLTGTPASCTGSTCKQ
jgi:hypothetical protein